MWCVAAGLPRQLPQEEDEKRVIVTSEEALREAFAQLEDGQTVVVDAAEIVLTRTLVVENSGVTLQGSTERNTTLRCSQRVESIALYIRYASASETRAKSSLNRKGDTRVENLNFVHCGASAVLVEAEHGQQPVLNVHFRNVQFRSNGRKDEGVRGAAVRANFAFTTASNRPSLSFTSCQFSQNRASYGGAIFASNVSISIRDCTFEENEAEMTGGAVFLDSPLGLRIRRSNFTGNVGHGGGGGLAVMHDGPRDHENQTHAFHISDCRFVQNSAYNEERSDATEIDVLQMGDYLGGALTYSAGDEAPDVWKIDRTVFLRNKAFAGGALSLDSTSRSKATSRIRSCIFEENSALRYGGGILTVSVCVEVKSTVFSRNEATYGGSLFIYRSISTIFRQNPKRPDISNIIEDSVASYGGGLLVYADDSSLDLSSLVIRRNVAFRAGGGICLDNAGQPVILRGVVIEENAALMGGGFAALASTNITITSLGGQRTIIQDNVAAVGGGLHYQPGESSSYFLFKVSDAVLRRNEAQSTEEIFSGPLNRTTRAAESSISKDAKLTGGGNDTSRTRDAALSRLTDIAAGCGGGICASVHSIRAFATADITFSDLLIEENVALVGGGLFAHTGDLDWNSDDDVNRSSCFPAVIGLDHCLRFVFFNVSVTKNRAEYAGGVFSSRRRAIVSFCSDDSEGTSDVDWRDEDSPARRYCPTLTGNLLSNGTAGPGADVGTRSARLVVEGWDGPLKEVASDEALVLPCEHSSNASCTRPLLIAVKDVFNQTIVRGIDDANLEITLESNDIMGDRRYTAVNGIARINNTQAKGVNVSSNLTVSSDRNPDVHLVVPFSTRACFPGEVDHLNSCSVCQVDQYSFVPINGCRTCEDNANCSGGAALVPLNGYWHSTPFSPVFRKCVSDEACEYERRDENLTAFYGNTSKLQQHLLQLNASLEDAGSPPDFSGEYPQCKKGYRGLLCGSCAPGYGRSVRGSCQSCPERHGKHSMYVCMVTGWLFLLIGFNCAITLLSMDSRVDLVHHEEQMLAERIPRRRFLSHRARKVLLQPTGLPSGRPSAADFDEDPRGQMVFAQQLIATVQLTETLKVTGTALRLQTDWNPFLKGLLTLENGIVGLPTNFLLVPYECNFENATVPASIGATSMRLAIPWVVLIALELVFLFAAALITLVDLSRGRTGPPRFHSPERFFTYTIVIAVVSMYFSYIDVVRELLRVVNCIKIDAATHKEEHPYIKYATEAIDVHVWAEDTERVCFRGSHVPVGIVSIVGLVISVCGIISIALWLHINKSKKTEPEFVARYWFLYQAYKPKWYTVAWESMILSRKSLLAGVVVFSSHLGPSLQAAMCAGILTAALSLHAVLSPFKIPENHQHVPQYAGRVLGRVRPRLARGWVNFNNSIHLNTLESVSLTSSVVMFYCAIVLLDSTSSPTGRLAMTAFAFALNVTVPFYMFYRLYAGLHVFLDLRLELIGAGIPGGQNSMMVPKLIRKILRLIRARRDHHSTIETESERGLSRSIRTPSAIPTEP